MRTAHPGLRIVVELLLVLAVIGAALPVFATSKAKPDGDEAEWIGTSRFFLTLFVERDLSDTAWSDSYWTRTQPMMARYVIGSWLWWHGHDLALLNPKHDHNKNWATNQRAGTAPSDEILIEARRSMRTLAAGIAAALYLSVRVLVGRMAGVIGGMAAAALLLGSPYLTEHLARAKGDTTLMFFWIAALAVIMAGTRALAVSKRVNWWLAALGGTLAGEHGDGRLRTPLLARVWPAASLALFAAVKHAFDPDGLLNPGVKVSRPGDVPLGDLKVDPTLAPLPPAARAALDRVTRERRWDLHRLDLLPTEA